MNRPRMLAQSARKLSEVFTDLLRRRPPRGRDQLFRDDRAQHRDRSQADLPFEESANEDGIAGTGEIAAADAVAAILLGDAFEHQRPALAELLRGDAITVIVVPAFEYIKPCVDLVRDLVGPDVKIVESSDFKNAAARFCPPPLALFGTSEKHVRSLPDTQAFVAAVQSGCPVLALATRPEQELPLELIRLTTHRVVMSRLDADSIARTIEAVTGHRPAPFDAALAKRVTLMALQTAVRADFRAEYCIDRLRKLIPVEDRDVAAPRLSQLHGLGEARTWGLQLIADLRAFRDGTLPWSAVDKGILLSGAPGVGKTLFARALVAEAAPMNFFATSYAQWQSRGDGHLGAVTRAIRSVFAEAVGATPCIVFIDEIDAVVARGSSALHDDWWTAVTNALLEVIDGFDKTEGVVVIAACNSPDRIDPALRRAGRLDKEVRIPLPDVPALRGILRQHLSSDLAGADLTAAALAARGKTGADVERAVRTARRAARLGNRAVEPADLLAALREGRSEAPEPLRRQVAYHEAGHAIAALALGLLEPVSLSLDGSSGLAELAELQSRVPTRANIEQVLMVLLSGRAAEALVFGQASAGAGGDHRSDLARATELAVRLETAFGLGRGGLVWSAGTSASLNLGPDRALRRSVAKILRRAESAAMRLLSNNREALERLAEALFERGYLEAGEIRREAGFGSMAAYSAL